MALQAGSIFLVADSPEEVQSMKGAFARANVRNVLVCFESAAELLRHEPGSAAPIFVIVCERALPDHPGLIPALRRIQTFAETAIFVLRSGSGLEEDTIVESGATGALNRPLTANEIHRAVRESGARWLLQTGSRAESRLTAGN